MKNVIRELFNHYKGKITENDNSLLIVAENTLFKTYNDDNGHFIIDKPVKIECQVSATIENDYVSVSAWESSYQIIGGVGHRVDYDKAVADLEYWLDKYKFVRNEIEQLSLF